MTFSDSKVWGPPTWYVMHHIALIFPENKPISIPNRRVIKNFYRSILFLFPCPSCRTHYKQTLSKYPIEKENKTGKELFQWTVRAHNLANKGLKKPLVSYKNALNMNKTKIISKFILFISYILLRSSDKPFPQRRLAVAAFVYLFSMKEEKIIELVGKSDPSKLANHSELTLWIRKLIDILRRK
jgi:hypothetical protein